MTDYFAGLASSGDPVADLQRFYQAVGKLDTLAHVTAVGAEAVQLARRLGVDPSAAHLAALAHDLAAIVPVREMVTVAEQMGIDVREADREISTLLHGPIAAAALTTKLGVQDETVLNAVRYHSTLRAGASALEKIVFLADKIAYDPRSPHQGAYVPDLMAAQSLEAACLVYLDFLLNNAWRYRWYLHPDAVAAYRDLGGTDTAMNTSLPQVARIVSVTDESTKVRTLVLDLSLAAEPGQFVMIWLPGVDEKPFSLTRADPVTLTIARVGPFSTAIHTLTAKDRLWLRGPLGQPFRLPDPRPAIPDFRLLLVGGGYGVAPMFFLAERALAAGWAATMVIGAQTAAEVVFANRFAALGIPVAITTDDGSLGQQGLATEAAERLLAQARYQALYACGPEPMLDATEALARRHNLPAQLSYERYMRCGFGVCGSCAQDGWLVCRDGPVRHVSREA